MTTTMEFYQLPNDHYDYDEDLKCPVCLDVLACPVARSCGHALCAACHFECEKTSSRCPTCRGGEGAAPQPNKLADAAICALVKNKATTPAMTESEREAWDERREEGVYGLREGAAKLEVDEAAKQGLRARKKAEQRQ